MQSCQRDALSRAAILLYTFLEISGGQFFSVFVYSVSIGRFRPIYNHFEHRLPIHKVVAERYLIMSRKGQTFTKSVSAGLNSMQKFTCTYIVNGVNNLQGLLQLYTKVTSQRSSTRALGMLVCRTLFLSSELHTTQHNLVPFLPLVPHNSHQFTGRVRKSHSSSPCCMPTPVKRYICGIYRQ